MPPHGMGGSGLIFVTGASGLLGANLIRTAKQRQLDVIGVYHQHALYMQDVTTVQADLSQAGVASELLSTYQPQAIVHCAALTDVDRCEQHPAEAQGLNVDMTRLLAAAAQRYNIPLIHVSTDSVFDGESGSYSESDAPSPLNQYSRSKLLAERAVTETLGPEGAAILRTNLYGWNLQAKQSLAEWMLQRLEAGQSLPGFEDVFFSPVLVNDLSEIILDVLRNGFKGLYHVGSSEPCSKYQFALTLAEVFDLDPSLINPVQLSQAGLRAPRPRNTSLKTPKIVNALGRPMPSIRAGLERFKELRDIGFAAQLKRMGTCLPSTSVNS